MFFYQVLDTGETDSKAPALGGMNQASLGRILTVPVLLEIMQKISGNGSLSNVKWLSVAGAKLTAEDWSHLENLTALETLTVGKSSEANNAKYTTEIPENCKLPALLKWGFFNTVTKIPAGAFKNNTGLGLVNALIHRQTDHSYKKGILIRFRQSVDIRLLQIFLIV